MTIILLISMTSKVLFGIYRFTIPNLSTFFYDSELADDWASPLYFIIAFSTSEFLPVTALLLTFWYGLTRRNKVIKSRKFSKRHSNSIKDTDHFLETNNSDDEDFTYNPFGIGINASIHFLDQRRETGN